ncbi:MAG: hypothetical protein Q4D89_06005 [Arachnia propionica]|uniref:hypothetical protein n=1 Tax=Arachnia propionica TaxID=1750 RepID=UPI0026F4E7B3|nr:hypothetical protein [Arachnia propionica]
MMRYWRSVMTVVVAVCLLVVGCSQESRWDRNMQRLRDDPMASASWEGLELVEEDLSENTGPKPEPPGITRCYKIAIPFEEALELVLATAKENGWVEDSSLRGKGGTVAGKKIGPSEGYLVISESKGSCIYDGFGLRISIGYE